MNDKAKKIIRVYLGLLLLSNFGASLIRGIDTLFLLDAGLVLEQVFIVYACMTLGTLIFEIPTGAVADIKGRRRSYLIGSIVMALCTVLYWLGWQMQLGFYWFALTTFGFGVGYTFFSGATEAWLVDALKNAGFEGNLEQVFSKAQIAFGISLLAGTLLGGLIAQFGNIGIPYILRALLYGGTFILAYIGMHDLGFKPKKVKNIFSAVKDMTSESISYGFKQVSVRWMILSGFFLFSTMFYIFYGMQPYLLELYGDNTAYAIAALAATVVAAAQIIGGMSTGFVRKYFRKRSTLIILLSVFSSGILMLLYFNQSFYLALVLLIAWGLCVSVVMPVRQSYLNNSIEDSEKRATVLSADSLVSSSSGIVTQPALARIASTAGYGASFAVAGILQLLAIPFLIIIGRNQFSGNDIQGDS